MRAASDSLKAIGHSIARIALVLAGHGVVLISRKCRAIARFRKNEISHRAGLVSIDLAFNSKGFNRLDFVTDTLELPSFHEAGCQAG